MICLYVNNNSNIYIKINPLRRHEENLCALIIVALRKRKHAIFYMHISMLSQTHSYTLILILLLLLLSLFIVLLLFGIVYHHYRHIYTLHSFSSVGYHPFHIIHLHSMKILENTIYMYIYNVHYALTQTHITIHSYSPVFSVSCHTKKIKLAVKSIIATLVETSVVY